MTALWLVESRVGTAHHWAGEGRVHWLLSLLVPRVGGWGGSHDGFTSSQSPSKYTTSKHHEINLNIIIIKEKNQNLKNIFFGIILRLGLTM